jgi:hypothetical protein
VEIKILLECSAVDYPHGDTAAVATPNENVFGTKTGGGGGGGGYKTRVKFIVVMSR